MAVGWTDGDAVLDQIQDTVNDEIHRARRNVPQGESLLYCEECGEEISEARRKAMPAGPENLSGKCAPGPAE